MLIQHKQMLFVHNLVYMGYFLFFNKSYYLYNKKPYDSNLNVCFKIF